MASNGHFWCGVRAASVINPRRRRTLTQMPQPIHSSSESQAILLPGFTSMHSLPAPAGELHGSEQEYFGSPILTTGQDFLHSCLHFLGRQRSAEMTAMRVSRSSLCPSSLPVRTRLPFGGMAATRRPARRGGGQTKRCDLLAQFSDSPRARARAARTSGSGQDVFRELRAPRIDARTYANNSRITPSSFPALSDSFASRWAVHVHACESLTASMASLPEVRRRD